MKLVLDTDVVRSGLQSPNGASRLLLAAVAERIFRPIVTVAVVLEYEDVVMRPDSLAATGLTTQETGEFLDGFINRSEMVRNVSRHRPAIQDPGDELFVEALRSGGGEAIVTFNRRDYLDANIRLASLGKIAAPVLTPGEALRRLAWRPSAITRFVFPPR